MPGLSATVGEEIEALRRVAGDKAVKLIRREPDETIARIVAGWPQNFDASRGDALGFEAEKSFDEIIRAHVEDELGGAIPGIVDPARIEKASPGSQEGHRGTPAVPDGSRGRWRASRGGWSRCGPESPGTRRRSSRRKPASALNTLEIRAQEIRQLRARSFTERAK